MIIGIRVTIAGRESPTAFRRHVIGPNGRVMRGHVAGVPLMMSMQPARMRKVGMRDTFSKGEINGNE